MLPIIFFVLFTFSMSYFFFGFYILFKNRNSMTNRIFFSLCINLSFWALGDAFMSIAPNQELANFWRMIAAFGWCLSFGTWLDFAILVKAESKKKWMTDIRRLLIYIPAVFFFIGNLQYEPSEVIERYMFIWKDTYPVNYFEILYILNYTIFAAAGVLIIYKWGKNSVSRSEKKQANIIVITASISFAMAAITDTILPLLGVDVFSPGIFLFSIALLGIRYAITKYKMMSLSSRVANDYILRTINDPVILIGNDLLVKEVNSAALDFTGFEETEVVGVAIYKFISDTELNKSTVQKLVETGSIKNIEVGLLTKSNSIISCLLSGASINNELEETLGIACVFHDITDRKIAESILHKAHQELENKVHERTQELEEINTLLEEEISERRKVEEGLKASEEKFRALMMQSSDGILVIDQDTRRIVESNEKALKIRELTESKTLKLNLEQLASEYKDRINSVIDSIIQNKSMIIKETIKYTRIDGANRDLELSASLVGYSNKQFVMVIIRDITEKVDMEERKQQLVKMEALGTLSGGIAHDFNNILAGIMGYTQLTLEDLEENTSSSENLSEVLKLGERAKKLISQILTFSRKTLITPDVIDLKSIIEEVLKMLRVTVPANIEIQCRLECNSPYVFADQGEIHQLIMNLCVNAELAMHNAGGILQVILTDETIEKEMVTGYQTLKRGKYIKLRIIDNGCGMEEAIIKRIFEPFFTTRGSKGGTGLGLSVVHGIVSRCEGVIMVDSEPNRGSTFTIFLPSSQNNSREVSLSDKTGNCSVARILLVDDEEAIVNTVQKLLQRQGYIVTGVLDAEEALRLFRDNKDSFDIVMTDQSMPNMTGDSLVKELRIIKPDIPVVISSGYSIEDNNSEEITEFLLKPVSKIEYVKAIEKLLKRT